MSNLDRVLAYLQSIYPESATNSQIRINIGIEPHQQVYQLTNRLNADGAIEKRMLDGEWVFTALSGPITQQANQQSSHTSINSDPAEMTSAIFERFARQKMEEHFGVPLSGRIDRRCPQKV